MVNPVFLLGFNVQALGRRVVLKGLGKGIDLLERSVLVSSCACLRKPFHIFLASCFDPYLHPIITASS